MEALAWVFAVLVILCVVIGAINFFLGDGEDE